MRGSRGFAVACLMALAACVAESVTMRTAEEVTLDLPAVPNAPGRLEVMAYEPRPGAGPELGRCAPRLRDTVKAVDFRLDATQAWQDSETRGDTTFVRYRTIGDFIPVDLAAYEMVPGQVVRVDCATYRVLGLADTR